MATLRKIKRAANPTHKPTLFAAHLLLPNRTKYPTAFFTFDTNFYDFL